MIKHLSFLPREKENWSYQGSFKYYSSEKKFNKAGGNTKVYGAALFRLREKDIEQFQHRDGLSPEWPIKYHDWENYYAQAEELFQVHGKAGEDPTDQHAGAGVPVAGFGVVGRSSGGGN